MDTIVRIFRISFFISAIFLFTQCRRTEEKISVATLSKDNKTTGIVIRGITLEEDELDPRLKVQLIKPGNRTPVLGDFRIDDHEVVFESVVPLTQGLKYEVLLDDTLLSEIEIPLADGNPPELLAIYPSQDTLPENLLKIYFEFSAPMVEGSSLDHITLVSHRGDTMKGTFLNLQPELWNADGTVLTVWLDPGRIKRDLIPNRELGTPLKAGEQYMLQIDQSWSGKNGQQLSKSYTKTFVTATRDAESPLLSKWKITIPEAGKNGLLKIHFRQSLDYFLAKETILIKNAEGDVIHGRTEVRNEEKILEFIPDRPWKSGRFSVHVESRLEDLAGNNLSRPFDRNVENEIQREQKFFTTAFVIP